MSTIKRWGRTCESFSQRALATAGVTHTDDRIAADAQAYWSAPDSKRWGSNSHWRNDFDDGLWLGMGAEHLAMYRRAARALDLDAEGRRVVDWGCGGGANAVHFAPHAAQYVGVDVSGETVTECGRQVAAVCDTVFRPVVVDVADPEAAVGAVGACEVFLCFYVLELVPTPEYGARLLRIARDLLTPGGLALVQIKYSDGRWSTRPRRRAYKSGLADMTTYPIEGFWQLAEECGLTPRHVELVPRNELDERYAYFTLTR